MLEQSAQIVTMYEDLGCNVAQIASACNLEAEAVKLCLLQSSARYSAEAKNETRAIKCVESNNVLTGANIDTKSLVEKNITDEEFLSIKNALMDLGLCAENEGVRSKTLIFLYNEHKGRNDMRKGDVNNTQINITMLNERLAKGREALEAGRNQRKLIDV